MTDTQPTEPRVPECSHCGKAFVTCEACQGTGWLRNSRIIGLVTEYTRCPSCKGQGVVAGCGCGSEGGNHVPKKA